MCGRYRLSHFDLGELAARLDAEPEAGAAEILSARNFSPFTSILVVRARQGGDGGPRRELVAARWGLEPAGEGRTRPVHARAETLSVLPAFRGAFDRGRCAVPATTFFERLGRAGRDRPAFSFRPTRGPLLLLAAVADERRGVAVVTVPASADVAPVHARMPRVLGRLELDAWLEGPGAAARHLLDRPVPAGILARSLASPQLALF